VNPYSGTHTAGNHAFQPFRSTYLKNETTCPKGLRDYWLGRGKEQEGSSCAYVSEKEGQVIAKKGAEGKADLRLCNLVARGS